MQFFPKTNNKSIGESIPIHYLKCTLLIVIRLMQIEKKAKKKNNK